MCSHKQIDRVVKWLEEGLRHVDDCTRDYIFLILAEEFLLLIGLELGLLQVRLSTSQLESAFVLTPWAEHFLTLSWVEVAHCGNHRKLLVLLHFEI